MGSITPGQVRKIHSLKGALGLEDDIYRAMLHGMAGVSSSKELTFQQAAQVIDRLEADAVAAGQWSLRPRRKWSLDEVPERPGMASNAQCRMILALWWKVSRAPAPDKPAALRSFLRRIAGVEDVRFLPQEDVRHVVTALRSMESAARRKAAA